MLNARYTRKREDVALPLVLTVPWTEGEAGLNAGVIKHWANCYNGPEGKDFLCLGCLERLTCGLVRGTRLDRWCVKCAHPGEMCEPAAVTGSVCTPREMCEPAAVTGSSLCVIPSEAGSQAGR